MLCAIGQSKHENRLKKLPMVPNVHVRNPWLFQAACDGLGSRASKIAFPSRALIVIHKCTDADLLQPGGLLAISRGLSVSDTPG